MALPLIISSSQPTTAVTFTLTPGSTLKALEAGTPANQQTAATYLAGVQTAANFWSSQLTNPINVNLTIDIGAESGSTLAATSPSFSSALYSDARAALASHATSTTDAAALAGLPAGPLTFFRNDLSGNRVFDNNNTIDNTTINVLGADAKALGMLAANAPGEDASILFGNSIPWDFNHGPTINSTQYDFVGVAIHEIGHALGFSSALEVIDLLFGHGPLAGQTTIDPEAVPIATVFDLFRHSAAATAVSATTLDLTVGGTPFFSFDGVNSLGLLSTGTYNGDGWGASHWKDNLGLGIMNPTFAKGERGVVSVGDLKVFDAIGFTLAVPEPSTLVLAAFALASLGIRARRHRARRVGRRP